MAVGDRLELARGLRDHAGHVDGLVAGDAARVGAREQEQVRDQPAHPTRGAQGRGGGLLLLAVEHLLQQLEVGQHRGQRRPQLVRRVGDELALAGQRRLRLAACLVERVEHPVQRASELGDLVLALGVRDPARRIASALDRAGGLGELGDRGHRAPCGGDAGQQRERGAAEHAEPDEEAHAVGGGLDVGEAARVLHEPDAAERLDLDRPRLDAVAAELDVGRSGGAR